MCRLILHKRSEWQFKGTKKRIIADKKKQYNIALMPFKCFLQVKWHYELC